MKITEYDNPAKELLMSTVLFRLNAKSAKLNKGTIMEITPNAVRVLDRSRGSKRSTWYDIAKVDIVEIFKK